MTTAVPQAASRPWLSIWTHPRSTYRALLDAPPRPVEWLLIMLSGFAQSLVQGYESSVGAKGASLAWIIPMAAVVGSIWGVLQYHLVTGLLFLVDRWTGGRVTYREMRTVTAWSAVPQVVVVAAWLIGAAVVGRYLFVNVDAYAAKSLQPPLLILPVFLVTLICCVWCVVILVKGIAEAQRGSAGKAVLTVLGAGALLLAAAFVVLLLAMAFGAMGR